MDDKHIVAQARRGELSAFEELVTRYEKRVYAIALRSSGSPEDAADITQEVFLRAWRSMKDFRGDSGFATWLFRITMNQCVDYARHKQSQPLTQPLVQGEDDEERELPLPDTAPSPEEHMENSELGRELAAALDEVSDEHRRIVLLRDVSGMSYTEIAEILEVSEGTVKSRLSRARIALRKILLKRGNLFHLPSSKDMEGGEEEYFEQLCSNSVDGTLTDSEKQKLEEHLAECPSCAALKEDLEQMHSMLAVDETEPPAGLHDSIMERLRQEETVRVVAPQKPMRRLPVFTMVAAAAVVVLVVLGGGLMPAFSTVGSGSTAAADSASADAGDGTADGGMQDEIEQSVQENADTSSGGASNSSVQQSGTASQSMDGSAYSGQNDTGEDSAANTQSDAGIDAEQYADSDRSIAAPEPITEEPVPAQVQTRPVLTLPQSLHGAHTAYCYVAVGGSSLPDIDGELLAQENGVSWFRLDNSMETLEKTLQTVEQAGCTVTAYDKVDLTIDSHADSWILAVVTG